MIARRRVMYLDDRPVELTDSYYPTAIAEGTALAEPRKIKGGAPKVLSERGFAVASCEEDITARPASPEEMAALQLPEGDWVLVLERLVRDSSGAPIEASVMTMPARQRRLHYSMKVG